MLILVQIDISSADIELFERYESNVLPLLARHRGALIERVRSVDGTSETHLLQFADAASLDAFRADPARASLQELWSSCGALSTSTEVLRVT